MTPSNNSNGVKVLVIDDDPKVSWILTEGLAPDFSVVAARDGYEGIQMASTEKPTLVLLDVKMPGIDGLQVLEKLKTADHGLPVVMLSGHGEGEVIDRAKTLGANEFLHKPFDTREVAIRLNNVLDAIRARDEIDKLRRERESPLDALIGDSPSMVEIKNTIEQIADSDLTVLIRGESGTGKEVVANAVHRLSSRRKEAFTKVNCAAIPRDLLEAELFGYEKGAFTGAHRTKPGRFEVASKGTIFLDEIGEMPMELQPKLLQVLEQQEFVRVGGVNTIKVDVRIVCATNRNLEQAIAGGAIRDDLYYRLNEISVTLPPLRERREDITPLVDHFLRDQSVRYGKPELQLSRDIFDRLVAHDWPGNVRQLQNIIKQIVVRQDENVVDDLFRQQSIPVSPSAPAQAGRFPNAGEPSPQDFGYSLKKRIGHLVQREERKLIGEVLQKTNWNRRKAADALEISYRSLLYKIKEYQLSNSEL